MHLAWQGGRRKKTGCTRRDDRQTVGELAEGQRAVGVGELVERRQLGEREARRRESRFEVALGGARRSQQGPETGAGWGAHAVAYRPDFRAVLRIVVLWLPP
jgi:hypothetical protein